MIARIYNVALSHTIEDCGFCTITADFDIDSFV